LLVILFLVGGLAQARLKIPSAEVRSKMLLDFAAEMTRLDGEALYVRRNRKETWTDIVEKLSTEAQVADSSENLFRTFSRLSQAYPNLHSAVSPGKSWGYRSQKRLMFSATMGAEWLGPDFVRYRISKINTDNFSQRGKNKPAVGDEILAINGRSIKEWQNENFEFCKFPLKSQCDFELTMNFYRELLSWQHDQPLSFTLKRGEKVWESPVLFKRSKNSAAAPPKPYCDQETSRYENFELVYSGNRACVYESKIDPDTAVLRITSFNYSPDSLRPGEPLGSLYHEVTALYGWWKKNATWKHLVIDLIDNHGGNSPVPYYQILFQHDFQEQYVTFKKTPEFENPALRGSIFWWSGGQEIWYQNLVSSGEWEKLNYGEFTNPVPMFCVDESKDCREGMYSPEPHPFQGRVSVLLNHWCVSSCDGFVYTLEREFGERARFFG
ncbi:MAG: hypothetical protein KDD22_04325, partial [Bdellovibrionales bacterium]|nr:hypothetical protein [Bdellovibrionales bacterium]